MTRPTMITWTTNDPTVSQFNDQIRDATNWTFDEFDSMVVYKSAQESVVGSTTFQNDDHLFFDVAASDTWHFRLVLLYEGSTAGDLKIQWTYPAGTTMFYHDDISRVGTASTPSSAFIETGIPTFGTGGIGTVSIVVFEGVVLVAGTGGTMQLQWAQNAASGTSSLNRGSCLMLRRIYPST